MDDKNKCPECRRDYAIDQGKCIFCGHDINTPEEFNPDEWSILFHNPMKENVEDIKRDLADHGVGAKVRYVNLSDFLVSIRSVSTWALLVRSEDTHGATELLQKLYGTLQEPEDEDAEALKGKYSFLASPVGDLAADESVRPLLREALHDPDMPDRLLQKLRDVFIAASSEAEDDVLTELVDELRTDHYAVRGWAVESILVILAEIGTEKTMQQLVELLTDDDSTVRINAIHCLQEMAGEEYARVMLPLLEDEDIDVRVEANQALEEMTGMTAVEYYLDTPELGSMARREWERLLKEA